MPDLFKFKGFNGITSKKTHFKGLSNYLNYKNSKLFRQLSFSFLLVNLILNFAALELWEKARYQFHGFDGGGCGFIQTGFVANPEVNVPGERSPPAISCLFDKK